MSDYFDVRTDAPAIRRAQKAFITTLLADLLPALQLAARGCGYAIAVHGSLSRDIDLVAIPWTSNAQDEKTLADRLVGVISSFAGSASVSSSWADKPHGRKAVLIYSAGAPEIDLSIMPREIPAKEAKE